MIPEASGIERIAKGFSMEGDLLSVVPYGNGHIHQTFLAQTSKEAYLLQRLHPTLFPEPEKLMASLARVCSHLSEKIRSRGGNPLRETLTLVPGRSGGWLIRDAETSWRMFRFIGNSVCHERVDDPEIFRRAGEAFGRLIVDLSDLDPQGLFVNFPGFHDTPARFHQFQSAVENAQPERLEGSRREVAFAMDHESLCHGIAEDLQPGLLPLRLVHNDTKLNNVLFDSCSGKALAVIDFDTIMPGTPCHDFGDAIRYGCNLAAEDEPDLKKVEFSFDYFRAFARGYLSGTRGLLTPRERERLVTGALTITFENGLRFLADHLLGDLYYRISRPEQNLDRCRTQFRLVETMVAARGELERIILEESRKS